jgi:SOS-response transcriptional repressor LexA
MTKRQKELLDFIRKYIKKHEMSPTHKEMAEALKNKSITGIGRMLEALASDGKITKRVLAKPRSFKIRE